MTSGATLNRLVVCGTLTLDTIQRDGVVRGEVPGGSALYAASGACALLPVHIVGTVGTDFPFRALQTLCEHGIDRSAIEVLDGPSFRWHARYDGQGDGRTTISRDVGVADGRLPHVPGFDSAECALVLASTDPQVQTHVLNALPAARLVGLDSMAHWWTDHAVVLRTLIARAHVIFVDETELRIATGASDLDAGVNTLLSLGPELVVVKSGSRGAWMRRRGGEAMRTTAVKLNNVSDPTGAGDAFAGALVAALATAPERGDAYALRFATAIASFAAEGVGTSGLERIDLHETERRMRTLTVSGGQSR